jgi:hypothetical protein
MAPYGAWNYAFVGDIVGMGYEVGEIKSMVSSFSPLDATQYWPSSERLAD